MPAHSEESPTFATGLVTNLDASQTGASKRNVQSCSFASFGLFLGTFTQEGSATERSFHTKKRCDRFYVIAQDANVDGNAVLDFFKLCLCWCMQWQTTKQSEYRLLPGTINFLLY